MKNLQEKTIRSYNETADEYAKNTLCIDTSVQREKFLALMQPHGSILDVGCGPGRDSLAFAHAGYDVTGFDPSEKLLEIAINNIPPKMLHPPMYVLTDTHNMFWSDKQFDGVWAMSVLMHLPKYELVDALQECQRVLKSGGPFYFCLKRGEGEGMEHDKRYDVEKYFAYYDDAEVKRYLSKTGFDILDFGGETIDKSYATKPWIDIFLRKK